MKRVFNLARYKGGGNFFADIFHASSISRRLSKVPPCHFLDAKLQVTNSMELMKECSIGLQDVELIKRNDFPKRWSFATATKDVFTTSNCCWVRQSKVTEGVGLNEKIVTTLKRYFAVHLSSLADEEPEIAEQTSKFATAENSIKLTYIVCKYYQNFLRFHPKLLEGSDWFNR